MGKRLSVFFYIVVLVMLGMAAFQFLNSADRPVNVNTLPSVHANQTSSERDDTTRYVSGIHLTAGICALLLVGYLFWFMIRKFQRDNRAELTARANSLYEISLATGRSEYDLFHKSAEGWSVSGDRIEKDFKRYMTDQVMPHYAQDFVRKNQAHFDESLVIKKEVKPTSWSDWAIALLVFPGSFLILLFGAVFL